MYKNRWCLQKVYLRKQAHVGHKPYNREAPLLAFETKGRYQQMSKIGPTKDLCPLNLFLKWSQCSQVSTKINCNASFSESPQVCLLKVFYWNEPIIEFSEACLILPLIKCQANVIANRKSVDGGQLRPCWAIFSDMIIDGIGAQANDRTADVSFFVACGNRCLKKLVLLCTFRLDWTSLQKHFPVLGYYIGEYLSF